MLCMVPMMEELPLVDEVNKDALVDLKRLLLLDKDGIP